MQEWYEHNAEQKLHGYGRNLQSNGHKFYGIYKNSEKFGYHELLCPANGEIKGEWKTTRDGKSTVYEADGKVFNRMYK